MAGLDSGANVAQPIGRMCQENCRGCQQLVMFCGHSMFQLCQLLNKVLLQATSQTMPGKSAGAETELTPQLTYGQRPHSRCSCGNLQNTLGSTSPPSCVPNLGLRLLEAPHGRLVVMSQLWPFKTPGAPFSMERYCLSPVLPRNPSPPALSFLSPSS